MPFDQFLVFLMLHGIEYVESSTFNNCIRVIDDPFIWIFNHHGKATVIEYEDSGVASIVSSGIYADKVVIIEGDAHDIDKLLDNYAS